MCNTQDHFFSQICLLYVAAALSEMRWMLASWDVDVAVITCSEGTAAPFMWERLGRQAMRIFFIAHPGQIDDLCCGRNPLSVYNVAFALHCSDPVTPKGNWFLPLCCPLVSVSSLIVFLILSSFFPSFLFSLCFSLHTHKDFYYSLHFSLSFHSFILLPSSLPPALMLCLLLLLLCTISQSHQLVFTPRFIRDLLPVSSFPAITLYSYFFFHFPTICLLTRSSPFSLFLLFFPNFPSISYFITLPSVCASSAKCYPLLLFSICLYVSGCPSSYSLVEKCFIFPQNPHTLTTPRVPRYNQ